MQKESGQYPTLQLTACGRNWLLAQPGQLEDVWDALGEASLDEDNIPYWVELWPSSPVLADWLGDHAEDISGRVCLDLGCGLGLTALAGSWLGGTVLALDRMADAARFCKLNARLNGLAPPGIAVQDWRVPAVRQGGFARAWAADIIYERRFYAPVLNFLDYILSPDGVAWIAEPGRTIFSGFLDLATSLGWEATPQKEWRDSGSSGKVTVWEFLRRQDGLPPQA